MRVLIIDDDALVRRSLRRLLRAHEVDEVSSSSEALARLAFDDRIDAILCDVMMPGQTGLDVLAAIRRSHPQLSAHFAFMTGSLTMPQTQELLQGCRRPCVEKPVERDELFALLDRLRTGVPDVPDGPA